MKLEAADYSLARFAQRVPGVLRTLGNFETDFLRSRLNAIEIQQPIFVAGLARSGTTILLELLASLKIAATHRYRDFPFVFVPWIWNAFQDRLSRPGNPVERPHRDRIRITKESPEAFEEPIWQYFFPHVHRIDSRHVLTGDDRDAKFDAFFQDHVRKILLIRSGDRYVSKGNYNVTRIAYLADLFPDARFVIPVRHPVLHVRSLCRQHEIFSGYALEDPRIAPYLQAAGHYEFGPHRVPVNVRQVDTERVSTAWNRGDDHLGYAVLWRSVYEYVEQLVADSDYASRVSLIRYEDLCRNPHGEFERLLTFCGLERQSGILRRPLPEVSAPRHDASNPATDEDSVVWEETCDVAERLGYTSRGLIQSERLDRLERDR